MNQKLTMKLVAILDRLIEDSQTLLRPIRDIIGVPVVEQKPPTMSEIYHQWVSDLRNVFALIGAERTQAWALTIGQIYFPYGDVARRDIPGIVGCLKSMRRAIDEGLLVSIEDLARAEIHSDMLEQAMYLHGQSYIVASGTLGRAVLEDHLRRLCVAHKCVPTGKNPAGDAYAGSLRSGNHIDELLKKRLTLMIGIGNKCAHYPKEGEPTHKEVRDLLDDVRDFVTDHPIS